MNLLADLIAVEERIAEMRALLRRQEAIIRRLDQLDAPLAVTRTAEELYGIVANSIEAARDHRDALAVALEKYPPDGVISTMQIGLLAHHWDVENLTDTRFPLPPPRTEGGERPAINDRGVRGVRGATRRVAPKRLTGVRARASR